tara:strand:- start:629 stop:901 length:273 start_codon:yes stop_codon:yes gene_type:complete
MILYDNQDMTTEVHVYEDINGREEVRTFVASQVFLSDGAYIVVGEEHILTFNSSKYSVTLKHNVREIQALIDKEYEELLGLATGKSGVVH